MRNSSPVYKLVYISLLAFQRCCAAPITYTLNSPVLPLEEAIGTESAFVFRLAMSVVLVLLGGVFAGLTIGLMGQDEVYLHVTMETGDAHERKYAAKVLNLLAYGKHWVLVTLLLSNVITNETLPIMLDRILGGGWPAVLSSTAAIVIFGEIIPQSICVRYGLPLGAYFAPFVKMLMYLMYPIAVPIAMILDYMLGEDHGTIYKKAGLKSLVSLHHHVGMERLNEDEVTIISAVLDLKDKPVQQIMTPIKDVFVLSSDTILDEAVVEQILVAGFNRIPIHAPNEPLNFVGMLLVRTLITYDPDDKLPISSFALATLPETSPDTSCLNILNYFQEGKAHMVAVSTDPGAVHGAVGVVTLEDVIEELIGEEIVDESDVFVDVQRAIRRATPAPVLRSGHLVPSNILLRPSNKASDPIKTNNRKITIKRGNKTVTTRGTPPPSSSATAGQLDAAGSHSNENDHGSEDGDDEHPVTNTTNTNEQSSPNNATAPENSENDRAGTNLSPNTRNVNFAQHHSYMPALHFHPPYCDDPTEQNKSFQELAKSPGSYVTKIPPASHEVLPSEREAIRSNLGPDESHHTEVNPSDVLQLNRKHPSTTSLTSNTSDDSRSQAFSENVVRVNGVNKVVIQEISSSSDSESN